MVKKRTILHLGVTEEQNKMVDKRSAELGVTKATYIRMLIVKDFNVKFLKV